MKKAEAERLVVAEIRRRLENISDIGPATGHLIYAQIEKEMPYLLNFKAPGQDKWQVVSGWINRHRLIQY